MGSDGEGKTQKKVSEITKIDKIKPDQYQVNSTEK